MGADLEGFLTRVRRYTDLPLVVGFGISEPAHVARVASVVQGAVVGSALIDLIERLPGDRLLTGVAEFVRKMKAPTLAAEGYTTAVVSRTTAV
jgi:tryptophan synthase alpha chain